MIGSFEVKTDRGLIQLYYKGKLILGGGYPELKVEGRTWSLRDGTLEPPRVEEKDGAVELAYRFKSEPLEGREFSVSFKPVGRNVVSVEVKPVFRESSYEDPVASLSFEEIEGLEGILCSTNLRLNSDIFKAFRYYTEKAALGLKPDEADKPPDNPEYPNPSRGSKIPFSCWAFPCFPRSIEEIPEYTVSLLARLEGGLHLYITVFAVDDVRGYVRGGERLRIEAYSGCRTLRSDRIHLCFIGVDSDPYEAVREVYLSASQTLRSFKVREQKRLPEIFRYLGWCSWNAFLRGIDGRSVIETVEDIIGKGIPVKYVIVDDGWHTLKERRLAGFDADLERFNGGVEKLASELKRLGVRWVGFWVTLQGYWGGLDPEAFKPYGESILEGSDGRWIPNPEDYRGFRFYLDFYKHLSTSGVDFLKIDNQYDILPYVEGRIPVGYAGRNLQYSIQSAASGVGLDILNCMCMVPEDYSFWISSNVARISEDYIPLWKGGAKLHLMICAYNSVWYRYLATPDYDMFQTGDPYGLPHAILRALSGGPIYLTDRTETLNPEIASKLAFSDGRLAKPDSIAVPTRDSLFVDPYNEAKPLKVFNYANGRGLIGVFNVNREGLEVEVEVSPLDVGFTEGRYVIYEVLSGETRLVDYGQKLKEKLGELECRLYVVAPVEEGFAWIGLAEVYIAPKGVESVMRNGDTVEVTVSDKGTVLCYSEKDVVEVAVDGRRCRRVESYQGKPYTYEYRGKLVRIGVPRPRSVIHIKLAS